MKTTPLIDTIRAKRPTDVAAALRISEPYASQLRSGARPLTHRVILAAAVAWPGLVDVEGEFARLSAPPTHTDLADPF